MKLSYSLSEDDFLQHQLYLASSSRRIQKKEQKAWKWISFAFSAVGAVLILTDTAYPVGHFSVIFGFFTILLYPLYVKKRYRDHYTNFIQENFQKRIGFPSHIELKEDHLFMSDKTGEGKIKLEELEKLIEIQKHFFLRMQSGSSIIFPKASIRDAAAFRKLFQEKGVQLEEDFDWERRFLGLPNFFVKSYEKSAE